ncbi:acetoacetate--CoA ligase [Halofilum ochraceum]|uniref:acetoacetate--CoA ligase n=1 Tax=Halofilum ochraceum TaxID=1611323 RepID=UPI0008DA7969|nr:acetoacetate--CoA ligase [Halofilum ochraceum]
MSEASEILRTPSASDLRDSHMARYMRWLGECGYGDFDDYASLYEWSISEPERFWATVWNWTGVIAHRDAECVLADRSMPGARWFPGARLNYAENLLREALHGDPQRMAVYAVSETRETRRVTYGELLSDVAAFRAWLEAQGVGPGDRVAGVVAHGPEAIVAMLATTALGAIWSSASPDFGVSAIVDRFGQIEPKVLVTVNGYGYNGKVYDRAEAIDELIERLPTAERTVVVPQLPGGAMPTTDHVTWDAALAAHSGAEPAFEPMAFDDPAFILYSSGTTGVPKCIVHGGGGTLLQHAKELIIHGDIRRDDVFFYFTTTGWMMWNWQVSALMTGAELVVFDGAPAYPSLDVCWQLAAERGVTHFGTSAKFIGACRNKELSPGSTSDLSALRVIFSTGSPLLPEDFDWGREHVGRDVLLASISGGTDIVSCFVGGCPLLPVRRGEIQCRMLGMDVQAWNDAGEPVVGEKGELVCRQPAPSMPVMFWNDPDGERYRRAYFDTFPGVWAHGDFITITESGGVIIHGRSDATLNPGGIRIGTAEIYRQVETMDEVADSIVAGQAWEDDERIVLLVVLNPGYELDQDLLQRMRSRIREGASPRHVPARIASVDEVPYTRSGKKVELAVSSVLRGDPVGNRDALANPDSLDRIAEIEELFV